MLPLSRSSSSSSSSSLEEDSIPPSQDTKNYWHCIDHPNPENPFCFSSGKFMVFVPLDELDATWEKVKTLVLEGKLGPSAWAATAKPNSNALNDKIKVILIHTRFYYKIDDIARIAWALYDNEIFKSGVLNYKTDKQTSKGVYANNSQQSVSGYSISIRSFEFNDSQEKLEAFLKMKYNR